MNRSVKDAQIQTRIDVDPYTRSKCPELYSSELIQSKRWQSKARKATMAGVRRTKHKGGQMAGVRAPRTLNKFITSFSQARFQPP